MLTKGRVAAIALAALCLGFVGGVWFFGSGIVFQLVPPAEDPELTVKTTKPAPPKPKRPVVKAVGLPRTVNSSGGWAGLGPVAARTDLLPAPGCSWAIEPRRFSLGATWHWHNPERALGGHSALEPGSSALHYMLVQSTKPDVSVIALRPVFFDKDANRHVPTGGTIGSSISPQGSFLTSQFSLDPTHALAPDKIAYFGIELVAPEAERRLAEAAQEEAREKGIEILPFPVHGQPYPFDLSTPDAQRLSAGDFRGKAVLIVVWSPSAFGLSALFATKQIRESSTPDELAIVGVSFDGSVEVARETFARSGADGPFIFVPNDRLSRRLWREGAGLAVVPQFYVLDRAGILRFVSSNHSEIKDRVDILFGRANRPSPLRPAYGGQPAQKANVSSPTGARSKTPAAPGPGA